MNKRQETFRSEKRADGWIRKTLWIKEADFSRGVRDAEVGSTNAFRPPSDVDRLSWTLGYVSVVSVLSRTDDARGML